MSSENSKTSKPQVLILNLTNKTNLRKGDKSVAWSKISIYYTWKNIKSSHNNNKFKVSAPTGWGFHIRYSRLFWVYPKNTWGKYW